MSNTDINTLPEILAGPIVRKVAVDQATFWLVTKSAYSLHLVLKVQASPEPFFNQVLDESQLLQIQVGKHAYVNLITVLPTESLPTDTALEYDISLVSDDGTMQAVVELIPDIVYSGQVRPSFVIRQNVSNILHGSCRKPHHDSTDGLVKVDEEISHSINDPTLRPDLLLMSGDQVYTDDVAGPTLVAINQTITQLGLFQEELEGAVVSNSKELAEHPYGYYQRPQLLPDDPTVENIYRLFFAAKSKPIFTSVNANNHLVSFAEIMAMYILTWSPEMWARVELSDSDIDETFLKKFAEEKDVIERFVTHLNRVRRALAHIPVYMIFDDHDITDDWNLTRGWEEAIYNNPFAKRIIGNALLGYWLCQGWGNQPDKFDELYQDKDTYFTADGIIHHDEFIDRLYDWDQWHYNLDTSPKIVVLDTRTQRWRSESSLSKPSGLMDWEALCDMQQELINQPSVILVSAAPIFGVKFIETVQRIFTFFGKALTVDAENWMAHKGTASVILNIFRHHKTPPNFVILSGDVHYSFVYDITLRFRRNSPRITQITCSGIKNQFPAKLLNWLDRLNRVLYARRSPLNWFTQRRTMEIRHRRPNGHKIDTLLNSSGIGQLHIDSNCEHVRATVLRVNEEPVEFLRKNDRQ